MTQQTGDKLSSCEFPQIGHKWRRGNRQDMRNGYG